MRGDSVMPGARPGWICSGDIARGTPSAGSEAVGARWVVMTGRQLDRATAPVKRSDRGVSTYECMRAVQPRSAFSDTGRTVIVAVIPETSGTPAGTASIKTRTGTRWARRTQV